MRLTDAQRYALEASGLSDHQQAEFCRRTARHNVRRLASQLGPAAAAAADELPPWELPPQLRGRDRGAPSLLLVAAEQQRTA
jgi:hypothetical protein